MFLSESANFLKFILSYISPCKWAKLLVLHINLRQLKRILTQKRSVGVFEKVQGPLLLSGVVSHIIKIQNILMIFHFSSANLHVNMHNCKKKPINVLNPSFAMYKSANCCCVILTSILVF